MHRLLFVLVPSRPCPLAENVLWLELHFLSREGVIESVLCNPSLIPRLSPVLQRQNAWEEPGNEASVTLPSSSQQPVKHRLLRKGRWISWLFQYLPVNHGFEASRRRLICRFLEAVKGGHKSCSPYEINV